MFYPVFLMLESTACVVWGIYKYTLYLPCKLLLQRLQRQQIVSKYHPIIEDILIRQSVPGMIGFFCVFQENPRLKLGPIFFSDPVEFQFLFLIHQQYSVGLIPGIRGDEVQGFRKCTAKNCPTVCVSAACHMSHKSRSQRG